jgi:hypothetical protein
MPSFTPDADLKLVYPAFLIPASVTQQLPSGLHVRRPFSPRFLHRSGLLFQHLESSFSSDLFWRWTFLRLVYGIQLRSLSTTDQARGHLKVLSILTVTPNLTPEVYEDVIGDMMLRGKGKGCP